MQPSSKGLGPRSSKSKMPVQFWPVAPSTRGENGDHNALRRHKSRFEFGRVDQIAGVVKRTSRNPPKIQLAVQVCPPAPWGISSTEERLSYKQVMRFRLLHPPPCRHSLVLERRPGTTERRVEFLLVAPVLPLSSNDRTLPRLGSHRGLNPCGGTKFARLVY